jgi:hypothetical protein
VNPGDKGHSAERAFIEWAASRDYAPSKKGWPDFLMMQGQELIAVEVKASQNIPLSPDQDRVTQALLAHGIMCFTWAPDSPTLTPVLLRDAVAFKDLFFTFHPQAISTGSVLVSRSRRQRRGRQSLVAASQTPTAGIDCA